MEKRDRVSIELFGGLNDGLVLLRLGLPDWLVVPNTRITQLGDLIGEFHGEALTAEVPEGMALYKYGAVVNAAGHWKYEYVS